MARKRLWVVGMVGLSLVSMVAGAQLDKILKGGGISFLIRQYGKEINNFANKLTKTDTTGTDYETKVVPILSQGNGSYIGAVQVMGTREEISKVVGVAQIEGKFNPLGMRVRALIPVSSTNLTEIKRVQGVGVSGLLDVKL